MQSQPSYGVCPQFSWADLSVTALGGAGYEFEAGRVVNASVSKAKVGGLVQREGKTHGAE